ncbi:hypothetical protein [Methylobacterium gnaphalii]|uniref:Uncharacterized protein n=1 Tax=Methylobacterium gnaphalii TaxID=1010610 RepID=A0A512JGF7_9HYPH|nr:hypothetical protein [Methylobacterium gnaphalii]GEP09040.1 hypothetical protein MGN01_08850 [Methylobacterium gnaphalii]GJD68351.1 hypothetical protein MMMDOFMJ_1274 [Methylobacterium gnaphalii]GLS48964.1 hypothetical protein GCM10007885_18110 [Methylobacterium gnaphalii]
MSKFGFAIAAALALTTPSVAQTAIPAGQSAVVPGYATSTGVIIAGQNNTGGDVDLTIPRGATGADTYQSDSAAAGNSNQPERAVPQGSGGGGSNSN